MFQRKIKRFNRRSNDRNHNPRFGSNEPRFGSNEQRPRSSSFINGQTRNKFRTPLSAEKLFEKYKSLAQEAMSSGEKTLSENYLQHADHFMRIIEDKNKNRNRDKINVVDQPVQDNKNLSNSNEINQDSKFKDKG